MCIRDRGTTGAYFEVVVATGVAALSTTTYLNCTVHGQSMIEPGTISFATGAAGQSGTGMTADVTVSGGAVTAVTLTNQGSNAKVSDALIVDSIDLGDATGSGFIFTLNSNNTGIATVSNISLAGDNYFIVDVLSVDDSSFGEAGGSCLLYTSYAADE